MKLIVLFLLLSSFAFGEIGNNRLAFDGVEFLISEEEDRIGAYTLEIKGIPYSYTYTVIKEEDKFYFPLFEFNRPGWMPFIGGDNFIFFSPIFNFADAAISCGVIILLLFYKKYSSDSIHMIKNDLKSKF